MAASSPPSAELLAFARHLGDAAAAVTLPLFRSPLVIDNKGEELFDPVTEADRDAEMAIRALIAERYPTHGIVGEEFEQDNKTAQFTWHIDPIDGTRAFVTGLPTWATLIGLQRDDEPYIGLMHQPFVGERFFASPEGAFLENSRGVQKLAVRSADTLAESVMASTSPEIFRSEAEAACLSRLRAATHTIRYGTDAYGYCLLAAGCIDLVVEANLASYDVMAVIPIVRQAGGVITTWSGGDPQHGGAVVAAANERLHAEALSVING
ncbi:histidinol-phosphatase [Rhodoligotrophos defluvii]|uniref:histidinol-phosphatase n=1 Tax=Rhodoligotrophos defluvii TaxID=2561934 RepID=UPI0010C96CC9|nr:histidinol-phosphatase [Rhodoligotrophos defluvii]